MSKMIRGKIVAIIVVCLLAVGVMPSVAQADPALSVSISPDTQTVYPGGTFSVNVLVDSDVHMVRSCKVEVQYDSTVFSTANDKVTYQDLLGPGGFGGTVVFVPDSGVVDGTVKFGVGRLVSVNPADTVSGTLITIEFDVSSTAVEDTYDLNLEGVRLKDENGDDIALTEEEIIDGEVVVEIRKGDFNGDGNINFDDFDVFCAIYGLDSADPNFDPKGDFNDDDIIDFDDFDAFCAIYGT